MIHAAGESSPGVFPTASPTYAVALAASEPQLLKLEAALAAAGIPHRAIREPDPPFHGALTAIGISPMERRRLRGLLAGFRPLR